MSSSTRRSVLITGASGNIGAMLTARLQDRYDLRLVDIDEGESAEGIPIRDVDIRSLEETRSHMDDIDSVVHLAGDPSPQATWESVYENNIGGTYNVLEAARDAGVRRVVFASSNHAMGMYDRHSEWPIYNDQLPRPDSFYGVSKAFGEALGRYFYDEHGLEFIALRIGWSSDQVSGDDDELLRAMWLSPDDTARAVERAIEAEVAFGIYYAVSDNPNRRWDLTNAMVDLGYRPEDSWEDLTAKDEQVVEGGKPADPQWPENS